MNGETTTRNRLKDTFKEIDSKLPLDARLYNLMLDKMYKKILRGEDGGAGIISRSMAVMFPDHEERGICSWSFDAYWKRGDHRKAITIYRKQGRPFWMAQQVGRYYERNGLFVQAMEEYDHLIQGYLSIGILPLPRGPVELFKVVRWLVKSDPIRARKYLTLYLQAEKDGHGTGFGIRHKNQASKLLIQILEKGGRHA